MEKKRIGLNAFQLKLIAAATMLVDHVAQFLEPVLPIPFWFHIIGRIAAPIFFLMTAWGAHYTHDRRAYLLRLHLFSAGMSLATLAINRAAMLTYMNRIPNNIFATLFLSVLCIELIERMAQSWRSKKPGKVALYLFLLLIPLFLTPILTEAVYLFVRNGEAIYWINGAIEALLPNIIKCEGGVFFVLLGVMFYFLRGKRPALIVFYVLFCAVQFILAVLTSSSVTALLTFDVQWMMILALPLMLLYNNEPGPKTRASKYFFYLFYPLHIFALYGLYLILAH